MPKKLRELINDLRTAGFAEAPQRGRGSHRLFGHANYRGMVTLSGRDGDDAKPYQESQVRKAIEDVQP